jgi:hypothetical protein
VDTLGDKRFVTLIVRLVLDRRGGLVHGEVVDVEDRLWGRFDGWRGLVRTLRAGAARERGSTPARASPPPD